MLCIILLGIAITLSTTVIFSSTVITGESLEKVNKSTQYEAERLDNWLSIQTADIYTLAAVLSGMDELAAIITADQSSEAMSLEEQSVDILRPLLESVLSSNDAFFEIYLGMPDGSAVSGSGYQFDYSWWSAPQRGWYQLAMTDTSKAHVTSPYVDAQTGELCITIAQAVYNNGNLCGVVGADVFVTELQNITLNATLDATGYSMLLDKNGDILIHPDSDYAPNENEEFNNLGTIDRGLFAGLWDSIAAADGVYSYKDASGVSKYYNAYTLLTTGWKMVSILPTGIVTQPITNVIWIVIPIAIGIMLIAALIIFLTIRRNITKPLIPITEFFKNIGATGDISFGQIQHQALVDYSRRDDEFGYLATAATEFVEYITGISEALEQIANGDLTSNITLLSQKDTMGNSLRLMLDKLNTMFIRVNASSDQVSHGARQVAHGAQSLAKGAADQATVIDALSVSMNSIATKTTDNAMIAKEASDLSEEIMGNAERGNTQMEQMMQAVKEINEASKQISKVIKVIDDIAFQTNILALNAAVEAARAGQHGKGFAVVADEVRNLASKSAEAAKDTSSMIENSINKANLGLDIATETSASLGKIVDGINHSSEIIRQIAITSNEQASAISQVNSSIDQVAQVVSLNTATSEESASASEEMSGQSDMLRELLSEFKLKEGSRQPRATSLPASSSLNKPRLQQHAGMDMKDISSDYQSGALNDYGKY